MGLLPEPLTCEDGMQSAGETDVDCGGPDCAGCFPGALCVVSDDCLFGDCVDGTCACPEGFEFADGLCQDVDECAALACGESAVCTNTAGGFECACPEGFMETQGGCVDMDECMLPFACSAEHTVCVNTPGDFECACEEGFTEGEQGCEDVDGCAEGLECPANAACVDVGGPAVCVCDVGFVESEAGCVDVDECADTDCGPNAVCVNSAGGFECRCAEGFAARAGRCEDVDECENGSAGCDEAEVCLNSVGGYDCVCAEGFRPGADGECVDVDECELGLAQCRAPAFCVNTPGGFECGCPDGYFSLNGDDCVDRNECGGQPCPPGELCAPTDECTAEAQCINEEGGYRCDCRAGWVGDGLTADAGGTGCRSVRSCAALKAAEPGLPSGDYEIILEGRDQPVRVHCDMESDGGVGYTMLRVQLAGLGTGPGQQGQYRQACLDRGLELLVPRSRGHFEAVTAFNGGEAPNLVGVYPKVRGSAGLSEFTGRCQGEPCDFYLSDTNSSSCDSREPSGDNTLSDALYRRAGVCDAKYNDAPGGVVDFGGYVLCSTNDVGPPPARSCQAAMARGSLQNRSRAGISGHYVVDPDGEGPREPYSVWCDQQTAGGGWSLALQSDGDDWAYADPIWTDDVLVPFEPLPGAPPGEGGIGRGKYGPFLDLPVDAVLLRFYNDIPGSLRSAAVLPAAAPIASLRALFRDGGRLEPVGSAGWPRAFAGGALGECVTEGANLTLGGVPAARLGLVGFRDAECLEPLDASGMGFNVEFVCPGLAFTGGICSWDDIYGRGATWLYVREPL